MLRAGLVLFNVSAFAHTLVIVAVISGSNANFLLPRIKRQSACSLLEFKCTDNTQCISSYLLCDGSKDCSDGSDENKSTCSAIRCPSLSFQCSYGACIEKALRCDGRADCADGSDERDCDSTTSSSSCLSGRFRCSNGDCVSEYGVCDGVTDCSDGSDETRGRCQTLKCPSSSFQCDYGACVEQSVRCNGVRDCTDGSDEWNCTNNTLKPSDQQNTVVCGLSLAPATLTPLILHGTPTNKGEFPWLAAVYLRRVPGDGAWSQQCGGTLITPHIVMTAAHCVVFLEGALKPEAVKVGLGKYYRDFYKDETSSVIVDVKEIVIPPNYVGEPSYYALDIALLDLSVRLQVTSHIMPACVDWTPSHTIYPDNIGHVAGWGMTAEGGNASDVVLSAQLNYVENAACIRRVRPAFRRLLTHDKFCVESVNGSQVAQGDSGGGLTAVRGGQHFVIGLVSTKLVGSTVYSLFTNISNLEHIGWMEQQRTRLDSLHKHT